MSETVTVAVIAAVPAVVIAYASVIGAVRSTQAAKETKPNGGGSMRDEIDRIGVIVKAAHDHASNAAAAAQRADDNADDAARAAKRADARATIAAEGVARADAFHLYAHDRIHDLANSVLGNRGQIAALRVELGLKPFGAETYKLPAEAEFPDRLYPPAGNVLPDAYKPTTPKETEQP